MLLRQMIMCSAATIALAPVPGLAQTPAAQPPSAQAPSAETPTAVVVEPGVDAQPSPPGVPATSAGETLGPTSEEPNEVGEIIVTAQRRAERLTDVPIAITALTAERLGAAGIVSSNDLAAITPGLQFPTQGAFAQPVIRGVGTTQTGPGADPNVAIYIDGVYQPNQSANIFNFNSVQQVEVLKGPQGTLFGRNATGGAITIRTLNPSFAPEARVAVGYGRFNDRRFNFYGSTPIVRDLVAMNLALAYRKEDSFTRNIFTGNEVTGLDEFAVRPKLLVQPSKDLSFVLTGNYSRSDNARQLGFAPREGNNTQNILNPALPRPERPYEISVTEDPGFVILNKSVSLRAQLDLDVGTLSSISAYGDIKNTLDVDGDTSAAEVTFLQFIDTQKTFSQEINFASKRFGILSFVAGLFYYDDEAARDLTTTRGRSTGPFIRRAVAGVNTRAYAVYSEVNLDLTDRLHLVGGLRYSSEEKDAFGVQTGTPPGTLNETATFSGVTPRASIRYEVSPASNVYATYSQGFKSGAFNAIALSPIPVDEETVSAYEVGYKLSRSGLRVGTSAYFYDYSNIQVQTSTTTGVLVVQNAGAAEIYGADVDFALRLNDNWDLDGGAAYTHGRYTEFPRALVVVRQPNGINRQIFDDVSGNPTARTPTFTANGTLTYTRDTELGEVSASATGSYNSGFYWQPDKRIFEPDYFILNGQVSFAPSERYRITLWGRNLLDERYATFQQQTGVGDNIVYDRPRSYGVTLAANF